MSAHVYFLFSLLPTLVWACASSIGGSSSKSAEFGISFFAPVGYTYPTSDGVLFEGQSQDADQANRTVKADLNLAIAQGLKANQIFLVNPPTFEITFTPPSVQIVNGTQCEADNTYIALSGTVYFKCTATKTLEAPKVAELVTLPGIATTLASLVKNDDEEIKQNSITRRHRRLALPLPRHRAAADGITSEPFPQSMTVTATASQALNENQWNKIARSVQQSLEAKNVMFNDDIQVVLL